MDIKTVNFNVTCHSLTFTLIVAFKNGKTNRGHSPSAKISVLQSSCLSGMEFDMLRPTKLSK